MTHHEDCQNDDPIGGMIVVAYMVFMLWGFLCGAGCATVFWWWFK